MKNMNEKLVYKSKRRVKCPCCSSRSINQIFKTNIKKNTLYLLGKIYKKNINNIIFDSKETIRVMQCKKCNLKFHKNIPNLSSLNLIYSYLIDELGSYRKFLGSNHIRIIKSKKLLLRLKNTLKMKSINYVDFGFGWGSFLKAGKEINLNTFGIETNELQKNFVKDYEIKVFRDLKEFKESKYQLKKFSLITLNQVLEHLTDPLEILIDLRNVSHNISLLYISVPGYIKKLTLDKKDVLRKGPLQPFEHLNCFSMKSINELAHRSGWLIISPINIIKNFSLFKKNYNIFWIIIASLHSIFKKGVFYLVAN